MNKFWPLVLIGALGACGGTIDEPFEASPPTPPVGGLNRPEQPSDASFATLLNDVRLANGAGGVAYDARLGYAAQAHAQDMLDQGYFSHTSLDGSEFDDRAIRTGYRPSRLGENIAMGQTSQAQVMAGWTASSGHHANNINPAFEDFGLGRAGSGSQTRWVLMLGAER